MLMKSIAMKAELNVKRWSLGVTRSPRVVRGRLVNGARHRELYRLVNAALLRAPNRVLHLASAILSYPFPTWKNSIKPLPGICIVLILTGCSNDVVPANATLSITPETHSTNIVERQNAEGRCLFDGNNHVDIPILMQLNTADGSPIGDTTLNVYADFAENTYTGLPVLKLYDDLNSNGVVDAEIELVSGADDSIARVKTDKWTGSRALLLRVNLSCAFKGEIFVYTAGISGRASIEVIAETVITPTPETGVEQVQAGEKT